MNNCRECKFWEKNYYYEEKVGKCHKAIYGYPRDYPEEYTRLLFIMDAEGYAAGCTTGEEFGCNLFVAGQYIEEEEEIDDDQT